MTEVQILSLLAGAFVGSTSGILAGLLLNQRRIKQSIRELEMAVFAIAQPQYVVMQQDEEVH